MKVFFILFKRILTWHFSFAILNKNQFLIKLAILLFISFFFTMLTCNFFNSSWKFESWFSLSWPALSWEAKVSIWVVQLLKMQKEVAASFVLCYTCLSSDTEFSRSDWNNFKSDCRLIICWTMPGTDMYISDAPWQVHIAVKVLSGWDSQIFSELLSFGNLIKWIHFFLSKFRISF